MSEFRRRLAFIKSNYTSRDVDAGVRASLLSGSSGRLVILLRFVFFCLLFIFLLLVFVLVLLAFVSHQVTPYSIKNT